MLIDPNDYRFTLAEVIGESSVDATNLRNWMAREVIKVGQKHKLGRWLFSITDIVRIRLVRNLVGLASMPPADANKIADVVVERFHWLVRFDKELKAFNLETLVPGSKEGRMRLMMTAGIDGPFLQIGTVDSDGVLSFPTGYDDQRVSFEALASSSPHLLVPVDEFIARTAMDFTLSAMEEEGLDWELPELSKLAANTQMTAYESALTVEGLIAWYVHHKSGYISSPLLRQKSASEMLAEMDRKLGNIVGRTEAIVDAYVEGSKK